YEKLEDGTYCGKIKECPGTIAFGKTLYDCQKELSSVLEGWLSNRWTPCKRNSCKEMKLQK
ncbi:MAG: type II toxin-antitoxin system HicB family antitoxin, partial [Methanosarcinales archaeon]